MSDFDKLHEYLDGVQHNQRFERPLLVSTGDQHDQYRFADSGKSFNPYPKAGFYLWGDHRNTPTSAIFRKHEPTERGDIVTFISSDELAAYREECRDIASRQMVFDFGDAQC